MPLREFPKNVRQCNNCRRLFRAQSSEDRFCSDSCRRAAGIGKVARSIKRRNPIPQKHRGSWSEIVASAWLLEQGYEVFKNVSSHGPIDLVAIRGVQTVYIDVKTVTLEMLVSRGNVGTARSAGGRLSADQTQAGITPLYVSPDGFCSFNREDINKLYSVAFKTHLTEAG